MSKVAEIERQLVQATSWAEVAKPIALIRNTFLRSDPTRLAENASVIDALSEAGVRLLLGSDAVICGEAFYLPTFFHHLQWQQKNLAVWQAACEKLRTDLSRLPVDASISGELFRLLIAEGVVLGPLSALARVITRMAEASHARLAKVYESAGHLGGLLAATGWFDIPDEHFFRVLAEGLQTAKAKESNLFRLFVVTTLPLLGFERSSPMVWLESLMDFFVLPAMAEGDKDLTRADLGLMLESKIYETYVKKNETGEHFERAYARLKQPLISSGRYLRTLLLPLQVEGGQQPCVGFYLPSQGILAHTQNLITFLSGLAQLPTPPIRPIVYVNSPPSPPLSGALEPLGAKVVYLRPTGKESMLDSLIGLRRSAQADGVACMVFVSNVTGMPFTTAMGVAPAHIWWSMKYRGLTLPDLSGYMEMAHLFEQRRIIDGTVWLGCHAALPALFDPMFTETARELRRQRGVGQGTVILGCIGREEKLLNRDYVRALGKIMRACPNTVYVWTGRSQPPEFLDWLREEEIAPRCEFVGWVKTKIFAQVLDVFLDSFPFASGHTAFETMAAGHPIVVLLTPEARETSTASAVMPAYEGKAGTSADQAGVQSIFTDESGGSLLPFVTDVSSYVDLSIRLIRDQVFRAAVGGACKAFVDNYMRDEVRLATTTCNNILEIIRQAKMV